MLTVNVRTDRAGHWLEQSILHLAEEAASDRAGSEAMLAKLSEALFVDTLRRYVTGLPHPTTGWLAGARDPVVGRSLALLHKRRVTRGRSPSSRRKSVYRAPRWWIASRAISRSRRWRI